MPFRQVTIYHNVHEIGGIPTGMADGYRPGDGMCPVFTYVATVPYARTSSLADVPAQAIENGRAEAEHAFAMFNRDLEDMDGQDLVTASQYRALRLRSLSVGDIVVVGRRAYICERFGFRHDEERQGPPMNIQPSRFLDSAWTPPLPHDGERGGNVWGR